jgi:hypothetical protein
MQIMEANGLGYNQNVVLVNSNWFYHPPDNKKMVQHLFHIAYDETVSFV